MRLKYAVILGVLLLSCACQPTSNTSDNQNTQANSVTSNSNSNISDTSNSNNNANANFHDYAGEEILRANNETKVEIYIKNAGVNSCRIEDLSQDDDSIYLNYKKGKVRWVVYNDCSAADEIYIDEFGKNNPVSQRSPFGADSCDNKFKFDPITPGEESRLISKTGKNPGTYKYSIRVKLAGGGEVKKDPQIEIGNK